MLLDRQSVVPLYYQIQQRLLEQIRTGALRGGDPVPSEQEISTKFGVSRMTARQALKSLCNMGVAYSQRGKGTFVSRIKLEKTFRQVLSFSEEVRARGSNPNSKVLSFEAVKADSAVAEALHLQPGQDVFCLKRVRMADSVPLCIETTHLPLHKCPDLKDHFDPTGSLYLTLASQYGIQIDIADEVAEASLATPAEGRILRIPAKSAVFRFTRTAYLRSGEPIEFVRSVYRGDRCKVVNRLARQLELVS